MEVLPCSRVAHIERKKKPYNSNIGFYTKRNALRVAEVWMDDYKSHVYIAWNLPLEVGHSSPSPSPWTTGPFNQLMVAPQTDTYTCKIIRAFGGGFTDLQVL